MPGYGFEERPLPAYAMLVGNTAEKTEKAMELLACVSKQVWDPKLVPPGSQYMERDLAYVSR